MFYGLLANAVLIVHLAFVVFVVAGGLLVYKWPRLAWVHLPAVVWAVLLEFNSWICPLTPLEQQLRIAANQTGYSGGFLEHYLLPLLYPAVLDWPLQVILGTFVIVINAVVYIGLWRVRRRGRRTE